MSKANECTCGGDALIMREHLRHCATQGSGIKPHVLCGFVPEPSVLERLRKLHSYSPESRKCVDDAIAEIVRLGLRIEAMTSAAKDVVGWNDKLEARLCQYTEAEVVAWEYRDERWASSVPWHRCDDKEDADRLAGYPTHTVRALIVAPKGDTE